jgi:hypothetical protein
MDKLQHHDPSFGYNTLDGLEEEDCVQARANCRRVLRDGGDPQRYWKEQDDGIHVLAVALYSLMKQQHFLDKREPFPVFLNRMIHSGALSNGSIQELNQAFFATSP